MDLLAFAHLGLVVFWLGVVAAEAVIELWGATNETDIGAVAKIHQATDRFIEMPLMLAIAATGLALWYRSGWSLSYGVKAGLGLATVAATVATYVYVERRAQGIGDAERNRRAYGAWGLVVIAGIPATIYTGGSLASWW